MKNKAVFLVVLAFLLVLLPAYGQQRPSKQQVVIKLASMVPENSAWGQLINKFAAEWERVTNNEVKVTVMATGMSSETDILTLLKTDQVQAAIFTSFGLNKLAKEILTLSVPFLIRSEAELDEVLKRVKPEFERKINSQNYYALALVKAGWVKFFSKNVVVRPADLKRQKIGSMPSEPELAQAFREMGYQVVLKEQSEILTALNGPALDAIYTSPIFAAAQQYFGPAKNMASINVAPIMGGIVLNKKGWESVPTQYRTDLIRVTRQIGAELEASLKRLEEDSIRQMKNNGLKEHQVNASQLQEWYDDAAKATPRLLGSTFDRDMYNRIEEILRAYRGRQ
ncbi:MAG: TRAP transporter substrate-binding protein DctP [Treponema sp.]|nr:TRAP transporter substrate-binding protein DctP [Treponema sp.]